MTLTSSKLCNIFIIAALTADAVGSPGAEAAGAAGDCSAAGAAAAAAATDAAVPWVVAVARLFWPGFGRLA